MRLASRPSQCSCSQRIDVQSGLVGFVAAGYTAMVLWAEPSEAQWSPFEPKTKIVTPVFMIFGIACIAIVLTVLFFTLFRMRRRPIRHSWPGLMLALWLAIE